MNIQFDGLNEIMNRLGNIAIEDEDENRALNKAAKVLQKKVIEEAPEDEGPQDEYSLKKNIKVKRAKDGVVHVHTDRAYHAHIVEGGRSAGSKYALKNGKRQLVTWGFQQANPFFTRAFRKVEPELISTIEDEIRKALKI